jgi:hypothetical protein
VKKEKVLITLVEATTMPFSDAMNTETKIRRALVLSKCQFNLPIELLTTIPRRVQYIILILIIQFN